jgi:hypothetical protein
VATGLRVDHGGKIARKIIGIAAGSQRESKRQLQRDLRLTKYLPALKSDALNLPSPSVVTTSAWLSVPPVISMRAPATTAPDESFTTPEMVSALSRPGPANHRSTKTAWEPKRSG